MEIRAEPCPDGEPDQPSAKLLVAHIDLSTQLRAGPRQMISLAKELRYLPLADDIDQVIVTRRGTAVAEACERIDDIRSVSVGNSAIACARVVNSADIIHVHDDVSIAAAALMSHRATPFIVTRRVLAPPKVNFLTRWSYGRASRVIGVSKRVSAVMSAYLNGGDVETIYDCVDRPPKFIDGNEDAAAAGNLVIGCVGRIDFSVRGQDLLLSAARRLLGTCPQVDIVFVGDGPDAAKLREASDGLHNVRHVGWSDDVYAQYRRMQLLVQPSRTEALGSTILEAMSMGLPVIASDVGGIPEIVKSDLNGLLIARDSEEDLVAAISRLANDETLLRRLGSSARRTADRFSSRKAAEEYHSTYLHVLAREQARRLSL